MFTKNSFVGFIDVASIADKSGKDLVFAEVDDNLKVAINTENKRISEDDVYGIICSYGDNLDEVLETLIKKNQIDDYYIKEGNCIITMKLPAKQFGFLNDEILRANIYITDDNDDWYPIKAFNKVHNAYRAGKFEISRLLKF